MYIYKCMFCVLILDIWIRFGNFFFVVLIIKRFMFNFKFENIL